MHWESVRPQTTLIPIDKLYGHLYIPQKYICYIDYSDMRVTKLWHYFNFGVESVEKPAHVTVVLGEK